MESVHFFVVGRVQGVGFRRFVARHAAQHHLSGWVQNTPDSMVEVQAVGDAKNIVPFLEACKKGPLFARVIDLRFVVDKAPITQYTNFSILR